MKRKAALLGMAMIAALLLGGCMRTQEEGVVELRATFGANRNQVILEVLNGKAARYVWNFGDGKTEETTVPKVVHVYERPGEYLVVVEGYGAKGSGDEGPGMDPGPRPATDLLFRLTAVVDTRPAIEIVGMKITPIDPPYWYAPGTPAWPDWHYPANVPLRFQLLSVIHRPGEMEIKTVQWAIFDAYGRFLKGESGEEWIWHEALNAFICYGCSGAPTEYRVYLTVIFTDGSEYKISQSIWACPSGGCRR